MRNVTRLIVLLAVFVSSLLYGEYQNTSLEFNGTTGYVEIPHHDDLNISNSTDEFTVEAWFKSTHAGDWFRTIISKYGTVAVTHQEAFWGLGWMEPGIIGFTIRKDVGGPNGSGPRNTAQVQTLNKGLDGQWHHLAAVVSEDHVILYINGIEEHKVDRTVDNASNTKPVSFARHQAIHVPMTLDEVRIWDVARTEQQIQSNMMKHLTGDEDNLIAYYNMSDDDVQTVLTDQTGNGHNGSVFGGVTWTDTTDELTLPVELSSFTAITTAEMFVELHWTAESETNMLGYNIYRSEDNLLTNAEKMNLVVIPANNVSQTTKYTYLDTVVEPGTNYYYWLEATDLDLTSSFHGPISILVEEEGETGSITPQKVTRLKGAYPNPFNPGTTISFSLAEKSIVSIDIFNSKGQLVRNLVQGKEFTPSNEHNIFWDGLDNNGNGVTSGIYLYIMETDNDHQEVMKMIMMK